MILRILLIQNLLFQGPDNDLARDWEEDHKSNGMIDGNLFYINQSTLTNGGNNLNLSGTTKYGTFNSGTYEKRGQEVKIYKIFFLTYKRELFICILLL